MGAKFGVIFTADHGQADIQIWIEIIINDESDLLQANL